MKKTVTLLAIALTSAINFSAISKNNNFTIVQQTDNVTATINKETTDKQFQDLKTYFNTSNIQLEVKKISRNSEKKITGLNISLQKGSQQTSYNMQSNTPILDLELGYKNEKVFIGHTTKGIAFNKNNKALSNFFNRFNQDGTLDLDSLISKNQFSFEFEGDDLQKLLNESAFNLNQIQEEFFNQFFSSQQNNSSKDSNTTPNISSKVNTLPKYNFINSKNFEKLIIIDGKETDFKTLDALAKDDKIKDVDNLKASTAASIYGQKAKHGAIIATTK